MNLKTMLAIVGIAFAVCQCAESAVLTGPINKVPESVGIFTWGDGINDLKQQWSVRTANATGWFYGLNYSWSNADVYLYSGLTDITTVTDASVFSYTSSTLWASETDFVFFRGQNGYYGAWRIDDIYPSSGSGVPYAYLDGQWYFQDDGSASFSVIPAPGAFLLGGIGAALVGWLRRRTML